MGKVRSLVRGEKRLAGLNRVVWDGTSDAGAPLPSGVYVARLEAGGSRQSMRLTLLK